MGLTLPVAGDQTRDVARNRNRTSWSIHEMRGSRKTSCNCVANQNNHYIAWSGCCQKSWPENERLIHSCFALPIDRAQLVIRVQDTHKALPKNPQIRMFCMTSRPENERLINSGLRKHHLWLLLHCN